MKAQVRDLGFVAYRLSGTVILSSSVSGPLGLEETRR
jgi:hypothetical protein